VDGDGWWRDAATTVQKKVRRPIIILGATGTLGNAFARVCEHRNLACIPLTRREVDIRKPGELEGMLLKYNPWAVVNATGYVRIDAAETEVDDCLAINTEAATAIAALCARYELPLICFSSDQVFGGDQQIPYSENDPIRPLNVYGRSKAMAEAQIAVVHPQALLIRTSAFFGPWDNYNFVRCGLTQLASGAIWEVNDPGIVSPTYVPDLVNAALDLLIDGEKGLWHLSNNGAISWHDFARQIAERGGYSPGKVVSGESSVFAAQRPAYSALTSEKGLMLPKLDQALEHFFTAS
jgi:dTDP-4-dehydrorhamnose reductase